MQDNITGNKVIWCLLRRKMKTLTVLRRETKRNLIVKAKKPRHHYMIIIKWAE